MNRLLMIVNLFALASHAIADVRVQFATGAGSFDSTVVLVGGKYNVTITATPSTQLSLRVESYPGGTTTLDVIRYVRVVCNGAGNVTSVRVQKAAGSTTRLVGVEEFSQISNGFEDGVVDVQVLTERRPDDTGGVVGTESGPGGSVSARTIELISAGGNINASLLASGNIGDITSNRGIFGDVLAPNGQIQTRVYANNDIGTSGTPVLIYGKTGVKVVQGNNIYADIAVDLSAGTPSMQRMRAVGNFTGTLVTGTFDQVGTTSADTALNVGGNLTADILVKSYFAGNINVTGDVSTGSRLRIGGSLNSSGRTFVSGPIAGQVIINGLNQGSTWTIPTTIDGTSLTGIPSYTQTSSVLGGGAIGRAPFQLHGNDCDPPNGGTVASLNRIKLRFYGPITISGSSFPVKVSYCPNLAGCTPQNWIDLSNHFKAALVTSARQITLTWSPPAGSQWGGTMPDGIWFVEPLSTNVINCADLLTTSTVPVATFEYTCFIDSSM